MPKIQAQLAAVGADVMVVAAYGLILPRRCSTIPPPRLPQYPRLAAAALARRGADPARDPGGRRGNRHHHHADGRGAGYRADVAAGRLADRGRRYRPNPARQAGGTGRAMHRCRAGTVGARRVGVRQPQDDSRATYAAKLAKARGRDRLAPVPACELDAQCAPTIPSRWPRRRSRG